MNCHFDPDWAIVQFKYLFEVEIASLNHWRMPIGYVFFFLFRYNWVTPSRYLFHLRQEEVEKHLTWSGILHYRCLRRFVAPDMTWKLESMEFPCWAEIRWFDLFFFPIACVSFNLVRIAFTNMRLAVNSPIAITWFEAKGKDCRQVFKHLCVVSLSILLTR